MSDRDDELPVYASHLFADLEFLQREVTRLCTINAILRSDLATAERRGAERALRWAWDEIGGGDPTDTADENRDCFAREGIAALFPATTASGAHDAGGADHLAEQSLRERIAAMSVGDCKALESRILRIDADVPYIASEEGFAARIRAAVRDAVFPTPEEASR